MPHDSVEPITNAALAQLSERLANQPQRARGQLLVLVRRIGIPIERDCRPTDGDLIIAIGCFTGRANVTSGPNELSGFNGIQTFDASSPFPTM